MSEFKFSPAAVPQVPVEVTADPSRAAGSVAPKIDWTDKSDWTPLMHEFDAQAKLATSQPRSSLFTILMLVKPPQFMSGNWGDVPTGWRNERDGKVLTFDAARELIDQRIQELGLDAQKVYSYPQSRGGSIQDEMEFNNASFADQMSQFRN